jgi:PPR repeat family
LVLHAWAEACRGDKSGQSAERAEQILNDMIKVGQETGGSVQPDCISFTMCIKAWARSTGNPDCALRAQDIFDRMANLYRLSQDDNVKPDVVSGNALVQAWARSRADDSAERAAKVIEDMEEFSEPDVYTYNLLIDAYVKKGATWRAYEVLTKLENSTSVKPDSVSFNSTLQALSKESFGALEAQQLLDRMIADGHVEPDRISYTCVMNAWGNSRLRKENGAERAAKLFDRMLQAYKQGNERLKPDTIACTAAIYASANVNGTANDKRAALKFATATFQLLKQNSQFGYPIPMTYHTMMRACSRLALDGEQRTRELEGVFQQCIDEGMLSRQALDIFVNQVTFEVQQKYSIKSRNPVVPDAWCRNVRLSDRPKVR